MNESPTPPAPGPASTEAARSSGASSSPLSSTHDRPGKLRRWPGETRFTRHLATRNWGWFALRGVLLVLLGVIALVFPGPTLFASALVFAAFSFADGFASVLAGIRGGRTKKERWWALIFSGLLGIVVGTAFLFFPFVSTLALSLTAIVLLAGYAIVTGVLQIVAAWRLRREIEGEWLLMLAGILGVLLGVALFFLLFTAPAPTLLVLAWMIGIWALASGTSLLVLAFRLRRLGDEDAAQDGRDGSR